MFKELVKSMLKYKRDNSILSLQLTDNLRKNIQEDLVSAYELSYPIVLQNAQIFEKSSSFLDFLLHVLNITMQYDTHDDYWEDKNDYLDQKLKNKNIEDELKQLKEKNDNLSKRLNIENDIQLKEYLDKIQILKSENKKCMEKNETYEKKIQEYLAKIQTLEIKNKKCVETNEMYEKKTQEYLAKIQTFKTENEKCMKKNETYEKPKKGMDQTSRELDELNENIITQKEYFQQQLNALQKKYDSCLEESKQIQDTLNARNEKSQSNIIELETQNNKLKNENAELNSNLTIKSKEYINTLETLTNSQEKIKKYEKEIEILKDAQNKLTLINQKDEDKKESDYKIQLEAVQRNLEMTDNENKELKKELEVTKINKITLHEWKLFSDQCQFLNRLNNLLNINTKIENNLKIEEIREDFKMNKFETIISRNKTEIENKLINLNSTVTNQTNLIEMLKTQHISEMEGNDEKLKELHSQQIEKSQKEYEMQIAKIKKEYREKLEIIPQNYLEDFRETVKLYLHFLEPDSILYTEVQKLITKLTWGITWSDIIPYSTLIFNVRNNVKDYKYENESLLKKYQKTEETKNEEFQQLVAKVKKQDEELLNLKTEKDEEIEKLTLENKKIKEEIISKLEKDNTNIKTKQPTSSECDILRTSNGKLNERVALLEKKLAEKENLTWNEVENYNRHVKFLNETIKDLQDNIEIRKKESIEEIKLQIKNIDNLDISYVEKNEKLQDTLKSALKLFYYQPLDVVDPFLRKIETDRNTIEKLKTVVPQTDQLVYHVETDLNDETCFHVNNTNFIYYYSLKLKKDIEIISQRKGNTVDISKLSKQIEIIQIELENKSITLNQISEYQNHISRIHETISNENKRLNEQETAREVMEFDNAEKLRKCLEENELYKKSPEKKRKRGDEKEDFSSCLKENIKMEAKIKQLKAENKRIMDKIQENRYKFIYKSDHFKEIEKLKKQLNEYHAQGGKNMKAKYEEDIEINNMVIDNLTEENDQLILESNTPYLDEKTTLMIQELGVLKQLFRQLFITHFNLYYKNLTGNLSFDLDTEKEKIDAFFAVATESNICSVALDYVKHQLSNLQGKQYVNEYTPMVNFELSKLITELESHVANYYSDNFVIKLLEKHHIPYTEEIMENLFNVIYKLKQFILKSESLDNFFEEFDKVVDLYQTAFVKNALKKETCIQFLTRHFGLLPNG